MNIGTISFNINTPDFNYGAMLHSWAFQQYLLKQEFVDSAEVIDYTMPILEGRHRNMPFIDSLLHFRVRTACKQILTCRLYQERLRKFNDFVSSQLIVSKEKYTQQSLNDSKLSYDTIICESDVIWSPIFSGGHFDKSFFLALDSMKNMTRIAYSPSMGNGDLNAEQEIELKDLLNYVDYISCRESYEKSILERYTEKDVTHVLDPVLLLTEDEYVKIIASRIIQGKYILLYLPVNDNLQLRKSAEKYAQDNNMSILEISTKLRKENRNNYVCMPTAGIEEFLSGIKYAECVFTNSFHAICFSVIFHTNFYAFSRAYAGKVKDICDVLGLSQYYFPDDKFVERKPINYEKVDERLEQLKKTSVEWLEQALFRSNDK